MKVLLNVGNSKCIAILLISFLVVNVSILGFNSITLRANADVVVGGGGAIVNNLPSVLPISPAIRAQSGVAAINNNLSPAIRAQSGVAAASCTGSSVLLTVNKVVLGVSDASGLQFNIFENINNNVANGPFPLSTTIPFTDCLNVNDQFIITEDQTTLPSGFSFGTPTYVTSPSSGATNQCSGTVVANTPITCTITNTVITGQGGNTLVTGTNPATPSTSTQSKLVSAQAGTALAQPASPTTAAATDVPALRETNPPFQTCRGSISTDVGGTNLKGLPGQTQLIRAPSAAKYIVRGTTDMDKVREALTSFNTKTMDVVLASDLQSNDGVSLAIANPQFSGKIIIQDDKDGAKQRVINYNIQDVRTECQFITLTKALGKPSNSNVASLGNLKPLGRNDAKPSDIDKLLVGSGEGVSTTTSGTFPAQLNPPFAECQTAENTDVTGVGGKARVADNLAFYNVKGDAVVSKVSGNSLVLEISVDLNQADGDLAKITNNNNPYVKVNLISDENKQSAHSVPFTLSDLFTDCKKINLATKTVFRPITNELNP
jgi:hypothetical protein